MASKIKESFLFLEDQLNTLLEDDLKNDLFLQEEMKPMEFSIPPATNIDESQVLKKFKRFIEKSGGSIKFNQSTGGLNLIKLFHSKQIKICARDDYFLSQFILDCGKELKLLNINDYRATKSVFKDNIDPQDILCGFKTWEDAERLECSSGESESDFSNNGEISQNGPPVEKKSGIRNYRLPYSFLEDRKILKYIMDNDVISMTKGKVLWIAMEEKKVCHRSWQSMKERFKSNIVPNLKKFHLKPRTQEMIIEFFKQEGSVIRRHTLKRKITSVSKSNEDKITDLQHLDDDESSENSQQNKDQIENANTSQKKNTKSPIKKQKIKVHSPFSLKQKSKIQHSDENENSDNGNLHQNDDQRENANTSQKENTKSTKIKQKIKIPSPKNLEQKLKRENEICGNDSDKESNISIENHELEDYISESDLDDVAIINMYMPEVILQETNSLQEDMIKEKDENQNTNCSPNKKFKNQENEKLENKSQKLNNSPTKLSSPNKKIKNQDNEKLENKSQKLNKSPTKLSSPNKKIKNQDNEKLENKSDSSLSEMEYVIRNRKKIIQKNTSVRIPKLDFGSTDDSTVENVSKKNVLVKTNFDKESFDKDRNTTNKNNELKKKKRLEDDKTVKHKPPKNDDVYISSDEEKINSNRIIPKKLKFNLYSYEDDMTILKYIFKEGYLNQVKGKAIWVNMEDNNIVSGRTWQSLKERFLKRILPRLSSYKLTDKMKEKFENINKNRAAKTNQIARCLYTKSEDRAIVEYIVKNKGYNEIKGNTFWICMADKTTFKDRSWQSMKRRFLINIAPALRRFNLTKNEMLRFHCALKPVKSGREKIILSSSIEDESDESSSDEDSAPPNANKTTDKIVPIRSSKPSRHRLFVPPDNLYEKTPIASTSTTAPKDIQPLGLKNDKKK